MMLIFARQAKRKLALDAGRLFFNPNQKAANMPVVQRMSGIGTCPKWSSNGEKLHSAAPPSAPPGASQWRRIKYSSRMEPRANRIEMTRTTAAGWPNTFASGQPSTP